MSVVNKMLQDLETRKKRSAIPVDYVPNEPAPFKPWMLGVSVVVIAAAILFSQFAWQDDAQIHSYAQQLPPATSDTGSNFTGSADSSSGKSESAPSAADSNISAISQSGGLAKNASLTNSSTVKPQEPLLASVARNVNSNVKSDTNPKSPELAIASSQEEPPKEDQGEFSVSPSSGENASISSLREQARIALNEGNVASAVNALERLVSKFPEDIKARKQLSSLLFSHNGYRQASQVLKDGLRLTPSDNAMRIMLARVAFKTGDFQDAHDALAAHPFPDLANIELISFRAALAERLNQYEDAFQDYKLLVAREPNNAKWWLGLGVSQDKLRQGKQALESYRQAKELKQLPTQVDTFVDERIAVLAGQI